MAEELNLLTSETDRILGRYLKEIQRYEPLSSEAERELAARIKEGDQEAKNKLIRANLRFVVSIARQYLGRGLPLAELISEGNAGLVAASEKFDGERGYKFISYAVWWIRQAILSALAEQTRLVRMPVNRVDLLSKISRASRYLEQVIGDSPSSEEIARELGMPPEKIEETLRKARRICSLDQPFQEDTDYNLLHLLEDATQPSPDERLLQTSLRRDIEAVLETLKEREAEILRLYFGLTERGPLTLDQIAQQYGLTRERVRQIKEKALKRMRHPKRRKVLASYIEEKEEEASDVSG